MESELQEANKTIAELQREIEETNQGILALNLELEQHIEELKVSEARFEALVSTVPDIIYRIDKEGRFTFLNAAIRLLGYQPEDLIGKHFGQIILPKEVDTVSREKILPQYLNKTTGDSGAPKLFDERRAGKRKTTGLEIRLIPKKVKSTIAALIEPLNTEVVPVEINSSGLYETHIKTGNKYFIGTVGVIRDITDRKLKDEELRKANHDLSAINKELESFAYSVSHDLRAPLRSIDFFSQTLLNDCWDRLDESSRDTLKRVRAASQRMATLIDELLNLSRLSRSEMKREKIDLSSLFRSIASELEKSDPDRKIEWVTANKAETFGDPALLRVVLENLIGNSWKFTGKHPRAKVEFGVTNIDNQVVYFVRDDGAGFEMEYAGKLFGAFQRLHSPSEFPGTGIGLATVQRIINRHHGRIWAKGKVEEGATFYFTLSTE